MSQRQKVDAPRQGVLRCCKQLKMVMRFCSPPIKYEKYNCFPGGSIKGGSEERSWEKRGRKEGNGGGSGGNRIGLLLSQKETWWASFQAWAALSLLLNGLNTKFCYFNFPRMTQWFIKCVLSWECKLGVKGHEERERVRFQEWTRAKGEREP